MQTIRQRRDRHGRSLRSQSVAPRRRSAAQSAFGQGSFKPISEADLNQYARLLGLTDEPDPTTLDVTVEARIDEPSGNASVRLRNWSTGEFEQVGSFSIGETDVRETFADLDASVYVSDAGEVDVSLKTIVFVPFLAFTFDNFVDQVEVVVR